MAHSPVDALIGIKGGCRLRSQIPVRFDLHSLAHLRITVLPQRWHARWGYARGLGVDTDVLQNLPCLCANNFGVRSCNQGNTSLQDLTQLIMHDPIDQALTSVDKA